MTAAPTLDPLQVGQLRRIFDLADRLPDDWSGMMGRTSLQEDFGGLRFQLAYMSYALALTHVHHLPAAPGLFRGPFRQLIEKMKSPDVWAYWHFVSTANGPMNNYRGEQPGVWDPIFKDNIMYSAYLQSMALMYHYLFRDDHYAQPGALTLHYRPLFWGDGPKTYVYDENSLNDHLYWNMVESGFLGIACEPNCVFQICNQVPILGFRMHDLVTGGSTATDVTEGYLRAWADFGVLNANGHYTMMVQEHERRAITPEAPWTDFWLGTLMHAWNPAMVEDNFSHQLARWSRPGPDGSLWIVPQGGVEEDSARASARDFGWAAACAAEVGDVASRDALLAYADARLHGRWEQGAYWYRRHDPLFDAEGFLSCMDPHTGNALLALARLNVPGGLRALYEVPLDDAHFASPALEDVSPAVDVSRAWYDRTARRLALRLATRTQQTGPAVLKIGHVFESGDWTLHRDGQAVASGTASAVTSSVESLALSRTGDALDIRLEIGAPSALDILWQ